MATKNLLRTAAVALAALTATTASAQFSTFPPLTKPGAEKSARTMQRVSPNLDKESGIMIYAATNEDGTMYNSWTSLRANQPSMLTRYFPWLDYTGDDDVYRINVQPATGAYNPTDGKYYVMLTFVYDCIWNPKATFNFIPQHWYSIDLANGATTPVEIADLREWSKEKGFTSYTFDPQAAHWGLWMDMAFDPIDETMYAMAQSEQPITDANPFHTALVQVSLKDGMYRAVEELSEYYLGFTYDLDGKVYAARWTTDDENQINGSVIVELNRETFEEVREVAQIKKNGEPFKLCYNGTMDVDRATGELYFAGSDFDNGLQSLFKINPKTGDCTYLGGFAYDHITGMHIPYVGAKDRNAPARVSNLRTEFAADGSNSITIKWTNPTTKWNLENLTSITGVKIYRDNMNGTPIADVKDNVTPGAEASYVDAGATQGLHTYYVVAYNESGDGVPDSIAAFVGKDTPDAPLDVVAKPGATTATEATISWSAPTTGLHNGWFDASTIKYKVTRSDGVVIGEDLTATTVKDNKLEDVLMMQYTYTVTSSNAQGVGGSSQSAPVYVGSAYQAPCKFDFKNEPSCRSTFHGYPYPEYSGWKNYDYEDGWVYWIYDQRKVDESLVSPQINVKAGHTYRVRCHLQFYNNMYQHSFELTAGELEDELKAFATDSFDETVVGNMYQNYTTEGQFTAEADGKYMVAFRLTSDKAAYDKITVFDIEVEEVLGKDVQAKAVSGYPHINRAQTQDYFVSVFNSGKDDASNIKVETGYMNRKGEFVSLGETTYTKAIASGETVKVSVPTVADYEFGTEVALCARVTMAGDEFTGNDICDATLITVEELANAAGFNAEFVGTNLASGEGYGDTNVPFSTNDTNTTSVTIYPASMLLTAHAAPYEISRIGFTAYNTKNIDPSNVKIYMGTTKDEMFTGDPTTNMINPSDLELVFNGQSTAMIKGVDGTSFNLDTPYVYDGTENLVVAVERVGVNYGDWYTFWYSWDKQLGFTRSLKSNAVSWNPATAYKYDAMPDLHLALKSLVGVDGINAESAFGLALNGRTILINGKAETLNVYDLAGRLLAAYNVNGLSQVSLNLPGGIYIIKAVDAAGNARTLKAAVR